MRCIFAIVCLLMFSFCAAEAGTIDVLWYTGGVTSSGNYTGSIGTDLVGLAATGGSGGEVGGHTWNVTFWGGGLMPVGSFDVMVVASNEGSWSTTPNYAALGTAFGGGLTLGDRVMVSGQDADWHFINTSGHKSTFDSSQGFLIDSINWAGSGTGMGAVFLSSDVTPEFIPTTILSGLGTRTTNHGDDVTIPSAFASFPINEGLTSAGISGWVQAHHDYWNGFDTNLWTAINTTIDGSGGAVTLVSADTASGGTEPVPEPASILLVLLGAAGIVLSRRRKQS